MTFSIGDKVRKVHGDYAFNGTVVAKFNKLSGVIRYVVENHDGILHIFSEKNLELKNGKGTRNSRTPALESPRIP